MHTANRTKLVRASKDVKEVFYLSLFQLKYLICFNVYLFKVMPYSIADKTYLSFSVLVEFD